MPDPQSPTWTTITATDIRRRGGELLDQVLAGSWMVVTRHGRPVAAFVPWNAAQGLDPEKDQRCAACAALWHGPAGFCPRCGVPQSSNQAKV